MYQHVSTCISMYQHVSTCINMYQHVSTCINHVSTCINMYQHVSACINMYQHVSTCINMYQHVSTCINMYQHVSTCINMYQLALKTSDNMLAPCLVAFVLASGALPKQRLLPENQHQKSPHDGVPCTAGGMHCVFQSCSRCIEIEKRGLQI